MKQWKTVIETLINHPSNLDFEEGRILFNYRTDVRVHPPMLHHRPFGISNMEVIFPHEIRETRGSFFYKGDLDFNDEKKIACESTRIPCIDHSNMFRTLVYLFLRPSCTELNYIPIYSIQPPPRILAWYPIISSIIRACLSGPGVQFNFRVFFPAFFGILVWMYEPSSHLSIYLCVFSSICLFTYLSVYLSLQ